MARHSKRHRANTSKVDRIRKYALADALVLLKSLATAKFDESVELSINLGIDPRQSDQQVRGSISLPKGIGREVRVVVFAEGEQAERAQQAGADMVGSNDLAEKIQGGWLDFDVALATPDMMRVVGRLGRVLGPQGKMPSPKSGTVTPDVATAVEEFKAGKVEFRNDSGASIHVVVGKLSFSEADLAENITSFLASLARMKPAASKGTFMQKIVLSSTMGPGLQITV